MVRLNLTGVGEGLSVSVTSILTGADQPQKVLTSIQNLFPSFICTLPDDAVFPVEREISLASENIKLDTFLNRINDQKTLDTALDAMSFHLEKDSTIFHISTTIMDKQRRSRLDQFNGPSNIHFNRFE